MSLTDEIEEKFNTKIEKLNDVEKDTYFKMLQDVQEAQLSTEKLKDYISSMRGAVENELVKTNLDVQDDLFLKARLKNYMLLEAFLTSPDKARSALEGMISKVKG